MMFELLTFHEHSDYMRDNRLNTNGMINEIRTDKTPEYSETLRDLITECVRPVPLERIELDHLREMIKSYRDRMHREYEETDDDGRAEFESENMLYYIRNEINNMPTTGEYQPIKPPAATQFPDRDHPILPPRFANEGDYDGPEPEDDLINYRRKRPKSMSPSHLFRDALHDFISPRTIYTTS